MHLVGLKEGKDTSLPPQGFAGDANGTDGNQPTPVQAKTNLVGDNMVGSWLQNEDFPARNEDSNTELDLRHRIRLELSQDVPNSERLEVAENIVSQIQCCTVESLKTLWEVMEDMTIPEADLESRKAAFRLLQASAIHLDLPSHRIKLFDIIATPVAHSVVNHQLLALNQLIQDGHQISGLEAKLAGFLIELMRGLFPSAERARQARYRGEEFKVAQSDDAPRQRPEEEKALLNCLSLISNLIARGTETFNAGNLEAILASVTSLARKTTGIALMRGFFKIIAAVTIIAQVPNVNLRDIVLLLCRIMVDSRYKFQADARTALSKILNSDAWLECLNILGGDILAAPLQSDELRCSILYLLADCTINLEVDKTRLDTFSMHLRSTCRSIREGKDTSSDFIDPLVKLAAECGAQIDLKTFHDLLGTIQDLSRLSTQDQVLSHAISESLVKLFLNCLPHSGPKAAVVYDMLLSIAALPRPVSVRLPILKLLARLRCDADYGIKVVKMPDGQGLAAALCRTKATAATVRESASPTSCTSSSGHSQPSRRGHSRASDFSNKARSRSRSGTRTSNIKDRFPIAVEPLWVYDESRKGLPIDPPQATSSVVYAQSPKTKNTGKSLLDLGRWLEIMINELEKGTAWELYSYILVHLPSQLSNCSLFEGHARQISCLHELLNTQLSVNSFPEPPPKSGIRRGDVALCLYHSLAMLLAYQDYIGVRQWNRTVSTFRVGIEKWDRVGKFCIHALALCCYEIPKIIENHVTIIVEMMQKRITQSDLAMDILEFLGGLAKLPEAYDQADIALHQKIFGICIRYLQHAREQRKEHEIKGSARAIAPNNRSSGSSGDAFRQSKQPQLDQTQRNLAEYVFTIAYQVIIFWFLAIDVRERNQHVGWITQELAFTSDTDNEQMDEQSLVLLDMMHRTAFSDLGETFSAPQFSDPDRKVYKGSWILGLSVITAEAVMDETSGRVECGQFTKRQASGTTHAVYYHNTIETPIHLVSEASSVSAESLLEQFNVYPTHMVLQLISPVSPAPAPLQPIPLREDDEFTNRALRLFDATDTVDGHKAAVIYIGDGQILERDILANTQGSEAYISFLSQLGTKVPLKDAKFNTQGLDRHFETDGTHTYAWRDRVTEIVFHVPTMMPNNMETDPSCSRKRAHIGNDHVKIIFNESGLPFEFNTFASDFNSVNIVITPEARGRGASLPRDRSPQYRTFLTDSNLPAQRREPSATERFGYFLVQAFDSHKYPDFSPVASPKIISACALPGFVRQLAMAASVFCQVWQYKSLGEYTSSWRFRLQQIIKLRDRYANANASRNVDYPRGAAEGPSSYVEGCQWAGNMTYGGMAEMHKLVASLDFTRWTK
ncbi:MAG: hypothetical protein Q9217_003063 [Psora testacea]